MWRMNVYAFAHTLNATNAFTNLFYFYFVWSVFFLVLYNRLCLRICILQVVAVFMGQADKVGNHFCLLDLLSDGFFQFESEQMFAKNATKAYVI